MTPEPLWVRRRDRFRPRWVDTMVLLAFGLLIAGMGGVFWAVMGH